MLKWILVFMLIPAAEIFIYIQLGKYVGMPAVVLLILATGAAGVILSRQQGFYIIQRFRENLQSGVVPGNQLVDGLLVLVGSILLLAPGLLTDLTGFIFLLPLTRVYVREFIKKRLRRWIDEGKVIIY
ncbi:FxsA family protein [Phosphitispora fastidiosa]|uniref:FxsA family protein n=1 Tax=Phosphitispora fastidiosa TaxID=2837202 RepID=UPI001E2BBD7A|nr:FxsA family protein [Phosphitispora fastidiosa]MBU7005119.1 UPF0716 protein FxsA [Phosphitispora fastidiosa]